MIESGKFDKIYCMVCSYQNQWLVLKTIRFDVNDQIVPNETKDAQYTTHSKNSRKTEVYVFSTLWSTVRFKLRPQTS